MSDMEEVDRGVEATPLESLPGTDESGGAEDAAAEFIASEGATTEVDELFGDGIALDEPAGEIEETPLPDSPVKGARRRPRPDAASPPLKRVLEAILFATDKPVTAGQLLEALPGREVEEVEAELRRLAGEYAQEKRGFRLIPCAGGYQVRSDPEMHEYVTRFLVGKRRTRLSRAAMETLAIIAYRQPITRGECEDIRGVDSGQVIHTLLERNLITIRGRSQALGRPLLYGTTAEFLRYFGLNTLADLPSPEELQSLIGTDPLEDPEIQRALEDEGFGETLAGAPADAAADVAADRNAEADRNDSVQVEEDEAMTRDFASDAAWSEAGGAPLGGG